MKRAVLVPVAAAALLMAQSASSATWQFEYTGLNDPNSPFPPIINAAGGTFSAEDANHDGVIQRDEVSALQFFGWQVVPVVQTWVPLGFFVSSQLGSFSYTIGSNDLLFAAQGGEWHDAFDKTETTLFWTTGIGNFSYDLTAPGVALSVLADGKAGTLAAPVPEPQTWALLLAGLVGMAGLRLARQRRQPPALASGA